MTEQRLRRELLDITHRYRAAEYFPSACVRVFNRRETLAVICVGEAMEDSLFDVASLTKIATATQILRLIGQGRLRLRMPLEEAFPQVASDPYLRERLRGVDLYRLLTHTSSLAAWYPFYERRGEDFFAVLARALHHTEPTEGVVYSDLNFMVLGKLLEQVQGKPLARCLEEDLVDPLGLGRMMYHPDGSNHIIPSDYGNANEIRMCREKGIAFDDFRPMGEPIIGTVHDGNCHYYFDDESGHAGIFADAEAYQRLCQFYMNTDEPLLIEAQREQPDSPGRGLGMQTGPSYPHGCGHTGFTGTSIYLSREHNIGAVAFTNRLFYREGGGQVTGEYRRALHEAVFALCAEWGE